MRLNKDDIFSISTEEEFNAQALAIFQYQAKYIPVYREYIKLINRPIDAVQHYREIPFLPIEFFKSKTILPEHTSAQLIFTSSGTTGQVTSQHFVEDIAVYEQSFRLAFEQYYGQPQDLVILALLPSYLERSGSSLIYMVDDLIKQSAQKESGYFLYNHQELYDTLRSLQSSKKKTILIGVTYALIDFIEQFQLDFPELIVMETGGMKGKRKEMIREELHALLSKGFNVETIHSEYGMTELLSQAYSSGYGIFSCPNWMKILLRDTNDPLTLLAQHSKTGAINVIDLANFNSCSFIATQDLGKFHSKNTFEILGRFDQSDIRGCNLLVQ